jgi:YHS domain-containing protein
MKKLVLLAGAALMVAPSAFATPDKDKKGAPAEVHCAVMTGKTVKIKEATANKMFQDYNGKRYFFCCPGCPGAFKANPAKFAKNDSIPSPKASPPAGKGKKKA